jgi:di/tricarboxylate transporter
MAIGFRLSANSNDNQAEALRNTITPNGCAPGSPANPNCASLLNAAQRKDSDRNWSAAGMVVAGMALVAVPVYWYWPRPNSSSAQGASNLRLNASLGSQYSGLGISSDF